MFCDQVVTLPFSNQQLREKFNNTYDSYVIDYKESSLKDVGFLSYLRNASIEAVVINVDKQLVSTYIKSINNIPTSNLSAIHTDLLFMKASNNTALHTGCIFNFLSTDEINELLVELDAVLHLQIKIITSLPLYLLMHASQEVDPTTNNVNREEVLKHVGKTWVDVATKPNVMSILLNITQTQPEDMVYFSCLDEYAFGGKNLFGLLGPMRDHAIKMLFDNLSFVLEQDDGSTTHIK